MSEELEPGGADGEPQTEAPNFDAEARLSGWRPKDEYAGPPEKWVDAEAFIAKRNDNVGMLRNDFVKLQRQYRDLQKRADRSEREGYQRAMETLARKQRQAVETGDVEAFDAAAKERENLEAKQVAEPVDVEQRKEEFIEWRADNTWYGKDDLLTDYADTVAAKLAKEKGAFLSPEDLAEVARKTKDRFGSKFPEAFGDVPAKGAKEDDKGDGEPARRRSPVEGVSPQRGRGAPKTGADLDQRGKEIGRQLVSMGVFKDLNEYAKDLYK